MHLSLERVRTHYPTVAAAPGAHPLGRVAGAVYLVSTTISVITGNRLSSNYRGIK